MEEGETQSSITTFDVCPMKWNLNYNLLLSGQAVNMDTMIGKAWHKVMEFMYGNKGEVPKIKCEYEVPGQEDSSALMEHWENILRIYAEEYAIVFKDEFANLQVEGLEQEIDITFPWKGHKIRLRGVIDLMGSLFKRRRIMDHKTSSNINTKGWQYKFQFMFYMWLVSKAIKNYKDYMFIVNGMVKPTIRVKKNETTVGFYARLRGDIKAFPKEYFPRETLLKDSGDIDYFEANILGPKLDRIILLKTEGIKNPNGLIMAALMGPNTHSCNNQYGKPCVFIDVCERRIEAKRFPQRKVKHIEINN